MTAAGAAAWLWLLVTLVVRDVLHGRTASHGSRGRLRRLVLAACGLSLAGGLVPLPGHAGTDDAEGTAAQVLVGLPVPDRMSTSQWLSVVRERVARHTAVPTVPGSQGGGRTVVVRSGDTLWDLAAASLAPESPAVLIERRWRRIYRENASVIGPDPHLIRPGQRLRLPDVRGRNHPEPTREE